MLGIFFYFVFLAPIAVIGVPYRVYQMASGALRARLEVSSGLRQTVGALGITLILVNVPILAYTLYAVYATFTGTSGASGLLFYFVLAVCGASYAVMELLLLPFTLVRTTHSTLSKRPSSAV